MKLKPYVLALASICLMWQGASALTINDPGVVGYIEPGTESANVDNQVDWANYLLSLGINETDSHDANSDGHDENYATGINDYSGTLSGGTQVLSGNDVSAYEWVLAKYDGQNGGYVLFNVADYGDTIPLTSETIWVNGSDEGYALSHFTGFGGGGTSVPDAGSSLALLGLAAIGLGCIRRKMA